MYSEFGERVTAILVKVAPPTSNVLASCRKRESLIEILLITFCYEGLYMMNVKFRVNQKNGL